jgi:prepilin-type N-terminal cleavage/methylation domain-containing protein
MTRRRGFTLIELLVAMSIGLIIMNVAFTALYFTRKFVRKGEAIGAKNDAMQSMMLWCLSPNGTCPPAHYPTGPQYRLVGGKLTSVSITGDTRPYMKAQAVAYTDIKTNPTNDPSKPLDISETVDGKTWYYTVVGTLYFPDKP